MKLSDILNGTTSAGPVTPTVSPIAPVDLAIDLMPHQVEARDYILARRGTLLADDMGLGKTAVAIAVMAAAQAQGLRSLVVVPPTLLINWEREINRFAPWMTVATVKGTKPWPVPVTDVTLIANSVALDSWSDSLCAVRYGVVVADESHKFKSDTAGRTKALIKISQTVSHVRLLMSGTPLPNGKHGELITQLTALGVWGANGWTKGGFYSNYWVKDPESRFGRVNRNGQDLHQKLTSTLMLRRDRHTVLTLEEKLRGACTVGGRGPWVKKYQEAQDDILDFIQRSKGPDYELTPGQIAAEALIRMNVLRKASGMMKVEAVAEYVIDYLEDHPNEGVFLVAEHTDVIDTLAMKLEKHDPMILDGDTSPAEKQEAVDRFSNGNSRILIGQITCVAEGLTLHGGGRNRHVVIVQLPWSPSALLQAEDRLHRIGQPNAVVATVMLGHIANEWTIDQRLWGLLETKQIGATLAIDGQASGLFDDDVESVQAGVFATYK